jgi:hypothetical protein
LGSTSIGSSDKLSSLSGLIQAAASLILFSRFQISTSKIHKKNKERKEHYMKFKPQRGI